MRSRQRKGYALPLKLYNTLTRAKDPFEPIDPDHVRMYVCGPTVYDFAHIGNARPVIVFDVLFRLLRHLYPKVTYVRNITDVDDKINARAAQDYPGMPLNEAIAKVTRETTRQFHEDIAALGVLEPTHEPACTGHIREMIGMIGVLESKGFAYEAEGHMLLDTAAVPDYGQLSGRSLDEMIAGARVEVAPYKKNPADSVLWKPSTDEQPGWDSPWGRGRPGWHIECSAMSKAYLGEVFDIHGGGIDLVFPHHENELAQSRCAHGTDKMANVWMHNGYLQVEGRKMSKSEGNFTTVNELLKDWPGEVLRLQMLMTHYRKPLDWTLRRLREAQKTLDDWYDHIHLREPGDVDSRIVEVLSDDLNTPAAITRLHEMYDEIRGPVSGKPMADLIHIFRASANMLGLLQKTHLEWFAAKPGATVDEKIIDTLIAARNKARADRDFTEADRIRDQLDAMGVVLKDGPDGTTWELKQ